MTNNQYLKQIFEEKFDKDKPIIFLDRDGVITKKRDYLLDKKDILFYKSSIKAIQLLNAHQFTIVIVTNQPAIARGLINVSHLIEINEEIVKRLRKNNAFVSAIYSCPHHPQANLPEYRTNCQCRKPGTLLLKDALIQFKNNVKKYYLIGDKTTDIQAGKDIGAKTFLVKTGYGGDDKKCEAVPDYICKNTLEAVRIILKDFSL